MDHNDRQAIEGLFQKLASVERQAPARDPEADAFIAQRVGTQPGAPYFMAQTIVVQEQALDQAQARIEQLEAELRQGGQQGGFLGRLFGGPAVPPPRRPMQGQVPMGGSGGGFLAGAAQTAMGVAGGVLLGNAIAGMFAGEAEAGEPAPEEDPGFDEGGFDDGEF